MKCTYRSRDGRMLFQVEGQSQKQLFAEIANIQSVFEADSACGCCSSPNIRFDVRTIEANSYYSLVCEDCGAALQFGQHRSGDTLYAKRSDVDRGWRRYASPKQIEAGNGRGVSQ